ncbi:hypothetical protein A9Q84_01045 [Halobacteriovorax marinus]|uniref:Lipoprotein n=1 Tax=Halobacteriovorax marinus TaxID=97084 RepID=A0A1Y5FBZ1_9BACT|nr:hypothetical protein A9Q84_01045 [Halobacteriovorax marinus]
MNKTLLLLSLLLLASCAGKRDDLGTNFNFSSAHVLAKGDRKVYLDDSNQDLDLASIHDDFDLDRIPDLFDDDIDNDGILNYADKYPYDQEKENEDIDTDGIPDFIDFEVMGDYKKGYVKAHKVLQERLFKERNVLIISVDRVLKTSEIDALNKEFFTGTLSSFKKLPRLKIIYKSPENLYDTKFAEYNKYWKTIVLYQNSYFEKDQFNFNNSLVHEVFHSIQKSHKELYQDFITTVGWKKERKGFTYLGKFYSNYDMRNDPDVLVEEITSNNFPSDYSKLGPEEMFAECATAFNFLRESDTKTHLFDEDKYNHIKNFKESESYRFFEEYFSNL